MIGPEIQSDLTYTSLGEAAAKYKIVYKESPTGIIVNEAMAGVAYAAVGMPMFPPMRVYVVGDWPWDAWALVGPKGIFLSEGA